MKSKHPCLHHFELARPNGYCKAELTEPLLGSKLNDTTYRSRGGRPEPCAELHAEGGGVSAALCGGGA